MDDDDKLLIYFEGEEHLVRRLGAAVVSCWSELPREIRNALIERAIRVMDDDHSDHLREQMKRFIAEHTHGSKAS